MALLPSGLSTSLSVVILSLFIHAIAAMLPARQSNHLADDFFSQNDQIDVPTLSERLASRPEPRLLDILQLRRVINDIVSDPSLGRALGDMKTTDNPEFVAAPKRLFCNNYTGCGGRFRGRRRMLQRGVGKRLDGKRPFCNSHGCLNGRKRQVQPVQENDQNDQNDLPPKRLFCNSYGGCQNFGKRVSSSRPAGETETDVLDNVQELSQTKLKRFLNGGYDQSMQSLLGKLRR